MKKKITITVAITVCFLLFAAVWQQNETVEDTPAPSKTHAMTAPQSVLQEQTRPIITEEEPSKVSDSNPIQEASTEELLEPAPEIELQKEPEPESAPPVQTEPKSVTEAAQAQESTDLQPGDAVYVPGFGWLESQGEGTVIYDEMMYENGNKVGIMG